LFVANSSESQSSNNIGNGPNMNSNLDVRLKPEEQELRLKKEELKSLEDRLVELELQLHSLRGELGAFERLYLKTVGVRYAELDEIEAQIAELLAQGKPGTPEAQEAAKQTRARADESRAGSAQSAPQERTRFSPPPSLKNLYREVARRIHPDLATDEADRAKRQKLMAEANRAYENGDEARLRVILEEYESSPESVPGQGAGAELVRVIRKIAQVRRRLAEIQSETDQLRTSDLFELKKKVEEVTSQGRDILNEMATAIQSQIAERQAELRKIPERENK
jgi:hypothetical protein